MEFSKPEEKIYRSCDEWKHDWTKGFFPFHKEHVHSYLEKYISQMTNGKPNLKIFFPLCGKDVSIKWLADQGHTVVGVEVSPVALKKFFTEQNLEYTEETVDNFIVFKSKDSKIRLYCGDLFLFSSVYEGKFDGLWDRGSLVALPPTQRTRYVDLVTQLITVDTRYLLVTHEYDQAKMNGPPFSVPLDDVHKLYESQCTVEQLEERDSMSQRRIDKGLDWMKESVYLLKLKSNEAPVVSEDEWKRQWAEKETPYHQTSVSSVLEKNLTELTKGRAESKVFMPLCGKSVDMKWLADLGHVVVGVEFSPVAIKEFFQEHELEYTEEIIDIYTVFKSKDNKIHLYCGDLFQFNSRYHGAFDGIWDRGSLVAINPKDRQKYATLMKQLVSPQGRYLLESWEYDVTKMQGPPFCIPLATVQELFEAKFTVQLLSQNNVIHESFKSRGLDHAVQDTFMLTAKTD